MVADGVEPAWHWGSVMRLGNAAFGLGRYFPMGDRRYRVAIKERGTK